MLYSFELDINKRDLWTDKELDYNLTPFRQKMTSLITECAKKNGEVIKIYEHRDLLNNWFPESGCHIFISHSHADKNIAISLANQLYRNFGIKSFIDSEFWGFVDDAILEINKEHSKITEGSDILEYSKSMKVASNFYLMLSNALTDGIYESDSFFFINTDNALPIEGNEDDSNDGTLSPWIYTELNYTSTVSLSPHKRRPEKYDLLEQVLGLEKINKGREDTYGFQTVYRPKRSHMKKVDLDSLINTVYSKPESEDKITDKGIFNSLDEIYNDFLRL